MCRRSMLVRMVRELTRSMIQPCKRGKLSRVRGTSPLPNYAFAARASVAPAQQPRKSGRLLTAMVAAMVILQTTACSNVPRDESVSSRSDDKPVLGRSASFVLGQIRTLDDPEFAPAKAQDALWSPLAMLEQGRAGVYFLEPYDPKRIPVLFVAGIGGTPRDFRRIIDSLDRSRFQAWVFHYPTGLRLASTVRILSVLLAKLQRSHRFDALFITGHSLGGLISRGYARATLGDGDYLKVVVTFSSPWEGHPWAAVGTRLPFASVPSWLDLSPGSEFLVSLRKPMARGSRQIPHFVFFGFRRDISLLMPQSSDGVISVASQLPLWLQDQTERYWGFEASHVGILSDAAALERYHALLRSVANRLAAQGPIQSCRKRMGHPVE